MTILWRAQPTFLILMALAGCGGALQPALCDGGACGPQTSWRKSYQRSTSRKLDVLFVVDDTSAIAPHAAAVATGVADIARALAAVQPALSLHVGFVGAGRCQASARGAPCGLASQENFLRSQWCSTMTNASGSFVDTSACLADLGAADCGPIQPLAAAVDALAAPPHAGWEGFLRSDAALLLIVVAATDDASGPPGSPTPVSDFVARLKALKPDPSEILVSVIGPADCSDAEGPGPRLTALANGFGANGLHVRLCSDQLVHAADPVTISVGDSLEPPCVANILDTDTATPGLQADCTFIERSATPDGTIVTTSLPSCDEGAPPCWRLLPGGPGAACSDGYVVDIQRPAEWCYEAGSNITIECRACTDPRDPACAVATR